MCGFPVSFLESHLIERRLARVNAWESFRRDPFHVSSLRLSWTSWTQTFLTCWIMNQICLPIEYPYRILSIFPTDSRRNQAGTTSSAHSIPPTRTWLQDRLREVLPFDWVTYVRSAALSKERAKMGAPITGCSRMLSDPRYLKKALIKVLLATHNNHISNRRVSSETFTAGPWDGI